MRVTFWASDKPRELMLAGAVAHAIKADGHEFEIERTSNYGEDRLFEGPKPETDLAFVFGVKGKSADIIADHRMLKVPIVYLDKGITRQKGKNGHTEFTRVFLNGGSPASYMMDRKWPSDRFDQLKLKLGRRRKSGDFVLFLGSSQKYHDFNKLVPAQDYAARMIGQIRRLTDQLVIFRPKPSDHDAKPVPGAAFSAGSTPLDELLARASLVVTHGSSAAVFAHLAGVPVISLGSSITSPVAAPDLEGVLAPFWPDDDLRRRWANAVGYCQWTTQELADGSAWRHIRSEVERLCA